MKYQSNEITTQIRCILMEHWDPIEVNDLRGQFEVEDEYDSYLAPIYSLLMDQKATQQAIAVYLYDVATRRMGRTATTEFAERNAHAAALIIALRPNFQQI